MLDVVKLIECSKKIMYSTVAVGQARHGHAGAKAAFRYGYTFLYIQSTHVKTKSLDSNEM